MLEILSYAFMQRALMAGVILALLLSLLGNFVVLKRMAFFSEGIAHASLAGVAIGIFLSINPLLSALLGSVFFAVLIYFIEKKYHFSSDTVIGIIFSSGMALGVLLMSLKPGYQPDLISFLFGNILAISPFDLVLVVVLSIMMILFLVYKVKSLTLLALDEDLAYVCGVKVGFLKLFIYVVISVSVVLGIKILGIILVSALMILPTAIAKIFAHSYTSLIWIGGVVSEIIVISGIFLSFQLDLPTGPTVVLVGAGLFLVSLFFCSLTINWLKSSFK